ncbi:EAL domain-containing protein [Aeromonas veronii]|uniref:EAL domain-containing protein n=1 Tax=Aeromonas TaxID=642 RepID=UPI0013222014|nr:EAL domain-containing protein [Aeromonas veronii]MXV30990.1 EAL domain-containing protein [Aeromonas veronii]HDZ8846981.1 EAL domain-containing protein [Aeromonas veronii]
MQSNLDILLVDDKPAVLNASKRELCPYFPHLPTGACAQEALELLKKHPVHMLIFYYRMLGMNCAYSVIEINSRYPHIMLLILSWQADTNGLPIPNHFFSILEDHHFLNTLTEVIVQDAFTFSTTEYTVSQDITIVVIILVGILYVAEEKQVPHAMRRHSIENMERDIIAAKYKFYTLKLLEKRCALDYFGTVYCDYEYLGEILFDVVKIDGQYIRNSGQAESSTVILQSMIFSFKFLSIEVISVWAYSNQQCQILQKMECDMVQGYSVSPAISPQLNPELSP